uniref:Uncharacterized protein n=1 Tax=Anguilla anguilla TaxID=7936 RepID=A0A0E9VE66_ANGAN
MTAECYLHPCFKSSVRFGYSFPLKNRLCYVKLLAS